MKKFPLCITSSLLILSVLSGCNKSVAPNEYKIDFKNYDGEVLQTLSVKEGVVPEYTGVTPTRPEYQGVVYTFDGWLPEVVAATQDAEYFAKYSSEKIQYTVSFNLNGGVGTIPEQTYYWGEKVTKPTVDPVKTEDADYTYTFAYWYTTDINVPFDFENDVVTSNLTLNAKYNSKVVSYVVTFVTNGGKDVLPVEVKKGSKLETLPVPERIGNKQYSYEFTKWYTNEGLSDEFDINQPVTGNLTLYAGWKEVLNKYKVTFKNYDGTVLEENEYEYGSTPSCSVTPTKVEDDYATYEFVGWDKTIVDVEDDATYIAQFNEKDIKWQHFVGSEATCEGYGVNEHWSNTHGGVSLIKPEGVISEGGTLTEAQISEIIASNPDDVRLIKPLGHHFDSVSGICANEVVTPNTDVFNNGEIGDGITRITETDRVVEGYDTIYEIARFYNDGTTSYNIFNLFDDTSLDDVKSFEFYIDPNGVQTFFAGPDGKASSGYQLHPHESFVSDHGTIRGVQTSPGVWDITAVGFKFRRMSDGAAVSSYQFAVQEGSANSLNTLFKNTNGWGASKIYLSEVKLTTLESCGATNITGHAIEDISMLSKSDNGMYKFNKNAVLIFNNLDITELDSISFKVKNEDSNNSFVLYGNSSICHGGIYGGENEDDTIIATRESGTNKWTVRRASGKKFFTINPNGSEDNYVVEDAQTIDQLFKTWSVSNSLYISDIVARGNLKTSRICISDSAFDVYLNHGTKGCAKLTKVEDELPGYGNRYTYAHTYNDGVAWGISNMFTDYSLSGVKTIEFFIDCMGSEFMFAGDDNTTATSYELHPNAGAQTPGYVRATQTSAGTWIVHSYGFNFRNMANGAQVNEFTFTNRNTLNELFHRPSNGYGSSKVTVSDIVITK